MNVDSDRCPNDSRLLFELHASKRNHCIRVNYESMRLTAPLVSHVTMDKFRTSPEWHTIRPW